MIEYEYVCAAATGAPIITSMKKIEPMKESLNITFCTYSPELY
jgi:hypothetical protein